MLQELFLAACLGELGLGLLVLDGGQRQPEVVLLPCPGDVGVGGEGVGPSPYISEVWQVRPSLAAIVRA
ncbi:hypothetical protein LK07_20260 [Streptomyces pluripotens]|uniref:Uncharacterized protein n=1 Tax=Streptomyces pluripotens TaxID=1355015 RepID=A0A221P1N8_9ACTN|nr:hypothetical protein LK06_019100 [Streptomyces pluripotens]ASN25958.1 hypothetical protein LK07_20260 [Streptomyces pluripotens]KIE25720.1 hypothetical protein LK08_17730 [Streptomyces sp. MUSC 125]